MQQQNPLDVAISKLDLQATLVLLNILSNKALDLHMQQAKKDSIYKLMEPSTAIKLPMEMHKAIL